MHTKKVFFTRQTDLWRTFAPHWPTVRRVGRWIFDISSVRRNQSQSHSPLPQDVLNVQFQTQLLTLGIA